MTPDIFAVMLYTRNDTGHLHAIYRTFEKAKAGLEKMLRAYECPGCYLGEIHERMWGMTGASVKESLVLTKDGTIKWAPGPEHYKWPSQAEFDAALEARRVAYAAKKNAGNP
jgi:hypothetical protein